MINMSTEDIISIPPIQHLFTNPSHLFVCAQLTISSHDLVTSFGGYEYKTLSNLTFENTITRNVTYFLPSKTLVNVWTCHVSVISITDFTDCESSM